MTTVPQATLVFANHRPETVPGQLMRMHGNETIILEEPADPKFVPMLNGQVSVEAYLETQDAEYPEFSRQLNEGLRVYHQNGIRIHQIEPFIEHLLSIHDRFAEGESPADLPADSVLQQVYLAERKATATLIHFYDISASGSFEETIEAVKAFAHSDADRFALRDRLRAAAMVDILLAPGSTYIEAGPIHYPIWQELRQRLPNGYPLKVEFLMADAVRRLGYRRHLYGPGDLLTLLYRFHPKGRFHRESLLAAQALIYNKLILKEEHVGAEGTYPHTRDELDVGEITDQLSMADCRILYALVRSTTTANARRLVKRYLYEHGDRIAVHPGRSDPDGQ